MADSLAKEIAFTEGGTFAREGSAPTRSEWVEWDKRYEKIRQLIGGWTKPSEHFIWNNPARHPVIIDFYVQTVTLTDARTINNQGNSTRARLDISYGRLRQVNGVPGSELTVDAAANFRSLPTSSGTYKWATENQTYPNMGNDLNESDLTPFKKETLIHFNYNRLFPTYSLNNYKDLLGNVNSGAISLDGVNWAAGELLFDSVQERTEITVDGYNIPKVSFNILANPNGWLKLYNTVDSKYHLITPAPYTSSNLSPIFANVSNGEEEEE